MATMKEQEAEARARIEKMAEFSDQKTKSKRNPSERDAEADANIKRPGKAQIGPEIQEYLSDDTLSERFWEKVLVTDDENDCWLWGAYIDQRDKRPKFWVRGRYRPAYRVSFFLEHGYVTPVVSHICYRFGYENDPTCVNPRHLRGDKDGTNNARDPDMAKITMEIADAIRERYSNPGVTLGDIAQEFGLNTTTVNDVVHGSSWRRDHDADPLVYTPVSRMHSTRPPYRKHDGDAGYDLYVLHDTFLPPWEIVNVEMGIRVQLPPNTWGLIAGRSSAFQRNLFVANGVIDNGYRGPIFATVRNMFNGEQVVRKDERVAQLILMPLITPPALYVQELSDSDRGAAGFGSTGR